MKVKTYLPKDDPFLSSKTELQWRKEKRAIKADAQGREMWNNQYCGLSAVYYRYDETYPATDEDFEKWRKERQEEAVARKAKAEERRRQEEAAIEAMRQKEIRRQERLRSYQAYDRSKIICLDVETTGLSFYSDEILQLSIIDGNGKTLFNKYIRPKHTDEWPEAEAIHGISPQMVADKPTIDDHIARINKILADAHLIVGYNSNHFDLSFMSAAGIDIPQNTRKFDVMLEFAPIYGDWNEYYRDYKWQKLCVCADWYGYQGSGDYHDSLEDVRATLHCFYAMTEGKE